MTKKNFFQREIWLTTSDAARYLDVHQRTVRKFIAKGKIDFTLVNTFCAKGSDRYLVRVDNFTR